MSKDSVDFSAITVEVEQKLNEAFLHRGIDLNKSLQATLQILKECEGVHFEEGIAKSKNQLGLFYLIQGEFEKAEQYSQKALQYFEATKNVKGVADAHYNLGSIYYRTNKYPQGLLELIKSLQGYRQTEDYHKESRTLKSMGTIYEYFNDFSKAIDAYEKAIEVSRKVKDTNLESNALNPLSGIYYKQGFEKLAFETIERSIQLKTTTNDIRGLAFALYGRAKIYIKQNMPQLAIPDLERAVEILSQAEDMLGLGMAYNKMGLAYADLGNIENANHYFVKALELGEKYQVQFLRFRANFNLYLLAKKNGEIKPALEYLEKYYFQKEQVINTDAYNIIKSYEALSKIEALEHEAIAHKEKNEIIERKNAELDSFFYRVSHDLKGPISSLLGLHNVVKMDIKEESALNLFTMYHSQVLRMNDIIMGLINLTEIKNTEALKTKIDFNRLVDECVSSCQYLPQFTQVNVKKDIQVFDFISEWAIVNTILQNLIENSIKYSRKVSDAFVKISISIEGSKVAITVQDNGQGVPQNHQANIFNMFYRANNRTQGSGLGLYILKRAVERLNGTIDFTSTLDAGSIFNVKIPA